MAMSAILAHNETRGGTRPRPSRESGQPPADDSAGWRWRQLSIVLLLTDVHEPAAEILPSLSLLSHAIRMAPASATAAAEGPGADAVLVDARRDLVQVRRLLRLLRGAEMNVPILAVLTEGGRAAGTADWGAHDVIQDTAGPGEVDAGLRPALRRMAPAPSRAIPSPDLVIP